MVKAKFQKSRLQALPSSDKAGSVLSVEATQKQKKVWNCVCLIILPLGIMCNWNLAREQQWMGSQPQHVEEGGGGDAVQVGLWTAWKMTPGLTRGNLRKL